MEHYFQADYIKVLKPVTSDGLNVAMDENFRGQFKEIHLPITALPDLNLQNSKLPKAQQMRIEIVRQHEQITKPAAKPQQKVQTEPDEQEEVTEEAPKKRGPKPKQHDLD
jgi:hypothetical protein